jgi:hypothetical protein
MPLATVSPALKSPPPRLKITDIECHVLLAPDYDVSFTSSAQDSLVVVIHTDGGVSGVGECDANPWMAKACIEAPGTHTMGLSIKDTLIGADPFEIGDLWRRIYLGTASLVGSLRQRGWRARSCIARRRHAQIHHALCLAAASRQALRGISRCFVRLGRARQVIGLHGHENRNHHERAFWPRYARPSGPTSP